MKHYFNEGEEIIKNLKQIKKLIKEEAPQIAMMRIDFLIDDIYLYKKNSL